MKWSLLCILLVQFLAIGNPILAQSSPAFSNTRANLLQALFMVSCHRCRMSLNLQLDGEAWSAVLADLAQALGKEGSPVRLCLIGSTACLFGGMDGRTSADLDIWKPASDYDHAELKLAAEKAGLLFDPKQTLEPNRPYLQLIEPGLTQLGAFEPVFIERIGRLQLFRPPIENLIAAKLLRAEPKDLGDIRFLMSRHRPETARIRKVISEFSGATRERATENLVYLDVLEI
jgi:hypothetical protein